MMTVFAKDEEDQISGLTTLCEVQDPSFFC